MADHISPAQRSELMAKIRHKNTAFEARAIGIIRAGGVKHFVRHAIELPGKPDLIFKKQKVAIFLDSCFWHGCPKHARLPKSRKGFWHPKIEQNRRRDVSKRARLRRLGWSALAVWEHDLERPGVVVDRVKRALSRRTVTST